MENYDPNFNALYQKGDLVVGGSNFGSGSSREQAATALQCKGLPLVIAGSFSQTYKRNAFNNGFVVFECPELVTYLRDTLTDRASTTVGPEITIDYAKSILTIDGKSFPFPAALSRRPGINRCGRRRKARCVTSPRENLILTTEHAGEHGGTKQGFQFSVNSITCGVGLLKVAGSCGLESRR